MGMERLSVTVIALSYQNSSANSAVASAENLTHAQLELPSKIKGFS
jgi:hypothetical protein